MPARLTALLVAALAVAATATARHESYSSQSQYEASCFPGCRCNRTVVECRDLGETTTELFRHIRPDIYPELDTLIVTGNQFGDLPAENLFGDNARHRRLTLVNLTGNAIRSLGAQTFVGMPRVEYLYLDDNLIEDVLDDQPFNYLTSLKLLSMSALFGAHISVNARADMLRRVLHSNHSFVDLKEVILARNRLEHLHDDTLCDVKGLTQLHLSQNNLRAFDFRAGCLDELHLLDLSRNNLTTVPARLWKGLRSLDTIDVSRNPLNCDCQLEPFHRFAIEEVNTFLNQETTTCAAPPALANRRLFALPDDLSLCGGAGIVGGGGAGRWLLLLVISAGLLLAYRYWRAHPTAAAAAFGRWELRRKCSDASRSMRAPLVADGYSQLKSSDDAFASDALPPPAFV